MSLDLPAHGEEDWDVKLNAALEQLDEQDTDEATARVAGDAASVATAAADATTKANAAQAAAIAAAATDATTKVAAEATARAAAITSAINALVAGAPGALDTLNEIALELADDQDALDAIIVQLAAKAALASPTFTGTPAAPTAAPGTNTTQLATTAFIQAAIAALSGTYQPLDSDLTAIAALSTTSFGRGLLTLADAAAGRTALGLGTAALSASGDFQPVDSDLTAIAALTTTSYGRGLLALADAAAARTALGLGTAALSASGDFQPIDSDLTSIAALTTTSYGRGFLALADAAAARTALGLGSAATVNTGTASGDLPLLSTGGVLPIARLATGTPDGSKFVRDDGTLATPSGGGASAPLQAITTGGTVYHLYDNSTIASFGANAGNLVVVPFPVDRSCTADRLGVRVVSSGTAGAVVRLGIYSDDGGGRPGALLVDGGTVASTTTGLKEVTISQALTAGTYWLAVVAQVANCTLQGTTGFHMGSKITTNPENLLQYGHAGFQQNSVTGSLPNPMVEITSDGTSTSPTMPRIIVRIT